LVWGKWHATRQAANSPSLTASASLSCVNGRGEKGGEVDGALTRNGRQHVQRVNQLEGRHTATGVRTTGIVEWRCGISGGGAHKLAANHHPTTSWRNARPAVVLARSPPHQTNGYTAFHPVRTLADTDSCPRRRHATDLRRHAPDGPH